ncbi:hypothetical protein ACFXKR_25775 [Streptomyces violascens]|uniref:hypothetical protein n=1 Tax=Streptomyces violascens TaxID=67381 RepID=UPI00367C6931
MHDDQPAWAEAGGRADQRGEYDDAFLDWILWWYLSTVELTNRLITSRNAS